MALEIATRASFLLAAGDLGNQAAQAAFARYYEGPIRVWCRRRWLEKADQDKAAKLTLGLLFEILPTFKFDPDESFKGLLRALIRNSIIDHDRKQPPGRRGSGATRVLDGLQNKPGAADAAFEDLMRELAGPMKRDQQLHAACERVRDRVERHTWRAFVLTEVDGRSAAEVGRHLGIKTAAVTVYKCRVIKMIESEIEAAAG
jgi:DNA-directed RNA polymerase specialized sigma24 family protein